MVREADEAQPVRVLLVEDSDDDARLVHRELCRSGLAPALTRVHAPVALREALAAGPWDVIIASYSVPDVPAPAALALCRELAPDPPVVVIAGSLAGDAAVALMRAGACDYIPKTELDRLGPSVARELAAGARRRQRVQMQARRVIGDRLAAMGMVAASVGHEISNPLAAVLMQLELMRRRLAQLEARPSDMPALVHELRNELELAASNCRRIAGIAQELRLFTQPYTAERCPVELEPVLRSVLRIVGNEMRHRASLRIDAATPARVHGSRSELLQAFFGLLTGALRVVEQAGTTGNEIRVVSSVGGAAVDVEIAVSLGEPPADTAAARPGRDARPGAFAPRSPHALDLHACQAILESHGGSLAFDQTDTGVCLRARLPVAGGSDEPPGAGSPETGGSPQCARVLVIDDEAQIASLIERLLAGTYEVLACVTVEQALDHIARGQSFDVILCDLMMPDRDGMEFYGDLARLRPELCGRVVFMTGGAFGERTSRFLAGTARPALAKPFSLAQLERTIAAVQSEFDAAGRPPRHHGPARR
jgi:CheY-like chemotaxis protein